MRRFGVPVAIVILVAAAVLALTGRWPWRRLVEAKPIIVSTAFQEISDTLRNGETLVDVFTRQGLSGPSLVEMFQGVGLDPRRLRAGLVVHFRREAGEVLPNGITIRTSQTERLRARRQAEAWQAERQQVAWTSEVIRIEGPIESSLYEALDATIPDPVFDAGNRIRLAWDLADVYAWSIDFNRDIQTGDRFAVVLSRETSELGEVRFGDILAADLLVSGKHQNAFRFEPLQNVVRFYDEVGNSLRRAFLRAPVEFRRISSSFSRSRFHPILGIWRRHEGTDYAAGSGTPVLAAGDGAVLRAGRSGGYGNLVELRHANGITTRYGHLRAFARGVRTGKRVSQGDVIGYVGATGLASAPHLHYEFRVHGAARDSRRVDLGEGEPLERIHLPRFTQERTRLQLLLGTAGQGAGILRAE
jgi:murein DD-endopeptidase MepM/ murein hydrolase activator NlpD